MKWLLYLEDFNRASIIVRLVLATVLGGILGMEREAKRHSAGFRTFTLVCIGATIATIANIYLYRTVGSGDAGRMAAGVISGVGFLGVGTIIVTRKNSVKGLTTAAALWTTACLGVALGVGMIIESVICFALIMLTISVFARMSHYVASHNREIAMYIEAGKDMNIDDLINYIRTNDYEIISMEKKKEKISKEAELTIMLELDMKKKVLHNDVIRSIGSLDCVNYVEEVRN